MAVFSSILSGVLTALVAVGMTAGATTTLVVGYVITTAIIAGVMFGGVALSASLAKKTADFGASSPTYGQGQKQTQTNQDLPIPLLYGTCKLAGNRIWQDDDSSKTVKRIVGFAEGEIVDFTDIRLNDIQSTKISGINIQKFYGTSTQSLPSMVNLDKTGSLKNIAYLAISVPTTNDISGNYNLTAVVKGRKIRVYTTPNNYTVKYSENPAWVCFDFLTSYNGLGLALDNSCNVSDEKIAELFDLQSFIESAAYCDELVTTNGVQSPRFTFNMIFDSQTSARDLLDEIYRSCRGGLFTKNGKLQFKIDKPENVSKIFTTDDIIKGSETFNTIPLEEKYEKLKIIYISPDHEWQKIEAYAELPEFREGAPMEHSVNCYSLTNFQQASRLAWYYLNRNILCPYFGSFQTNYKAFDLEVGDVIEINSILMGLENYQVKVTSVSDDGTGVFTVQYRNYDPDLYNDQLGCQEPTVLVTNLIDLYVNPDDVQNFNVVQQNNLFNFVWQYNQSAIDTYEIRMGNSWETGEVIVSNLRQNTYSTKINAKGTYKFWIKAFNKYNYSINPTLDVISVTDIPNVNEVLSLDVFEDMQGTFEHAYMYNGNLKLEVDNVLWQTTENKWGVDTYYQSGGKWGANVYSQGSYTSQVYDLGGFLDCIISYSVDYYSPDEQSDILLEWRYSEDNVTWTDWQILNIGEYQFQYYQIKITLNAYNKTQTLVSALKLTIDVADKFETQEAEVISADDGVLINYDFVSIPSIVATVQENISAYAVVDKVTQTNKQATIYIRNNEGYLTTGKVSCYIKGY